MPVSNIQKETFEKLLNQIRTQVLYYKKSNKELKRENDLLRAKMSDMQKNQSDIFSSIGESERIAMKHQVNGLIEKIDKYLDE
jgi:cell division protein FtsB